MITHQFPVSAFQRLLVNDKSDPFKIIISIKDIKKQDQNFVIEKCNQVMTSTTINKARVISKTINEMYLIDPSLKQFEFEISSKTENRKKLKTAEVVEIFQIILNSITQEVIISGDQQEIFALILSILGEENVNINMNPNENIIISDGPQQVKDMNVFKCEYEGDQLSGIISCIKQMSGGNLDENNDLKLSAGGSTDPSHPLSNIIMYDSEHINHYFYNFKSPIKNDDGWIEFDFLNRKVQIISYTIRTNGNEQFFYHPKSWKIIGSNDHVYWDMIDMEKNRKELNGSNKQSYFLCNKNNRKFYKYIRFVQFQSWGNQIGSNFIYLSCIELFGSISSP